MGRRTILGSLFIAILLAALLFFVLYFFVPSLSDAFLNVSYQGKRDVKQLKEAVESVLVSARVPQVDIDAYLAKIDESKLYATVQEASKKGGDVLYSYLAKVGEEVDLDGLKAEELEMTLKKGLEETSKYTTRQIETLKRIFSDVLDTN